MAFFNRFNEEIEHRISRPMNLDDLISSIKSLETKGIISFKDFKELSFNEIKNRYFGMTHPTQITKAIIKIHDEKEGKTEISSLTTVTKHFKNGEWKKTIRKTDFF